MKCCAHCGKYSKVNGQYLCRDCNATERHEYALSLSGLSNENFAEAMRQYDLDEGEYK